MNRREFLTYTWGAALGLLVLEVGAGMFGFMYPRFKAGEFGLTYGDIKWRAAECYRRKTGKALPPSVDPETPLSAYKALGIDPMNMVLQGMPTIGDMMNGFTQSQANYMDAYAARNPSQFIEAYNDLQSRYLQINNLHPEAKSYLPWTPEGLPSALAKFRTGWQQQEMTPYEAATQGMAIGDSLIKSVMNAAAIGGWSAVENIIDGIEEQRQPGDPFWQMIPRFQVDDIRTPAMNADGTPVMKDGKPVYTTTPGLRSRVESWHEQNMAGEMMDFELAKANFALTMRKAALAMGSGGAGTGRRGGTGSGTGSGDTPGSVFSLLPKGIKFSDARLATQYLDKKFNENLEKLGRPRECVDMDPPLDPLPAAAGHRVACHFPDRGGELAASAGSAMTDGPVSASTVAPPAS